MTHTDTGSQPLIIAPSDLSFLLRECPRCFYLKVVAHIRRPDTPFPGVFSKMDNQQRSFFDETSATGLIDGFPAGTIRTRGLSVRSKPLALATRHGEVQIVIRGAMDAAVIDGNTASVVDFKVSAAHDRLTDRYSSSLHAYAYACEHPASEEVIYLPDVTGLGLLCFDPTELMTLPENGFAFRMKVTFIPITRDNTQFIRTMKDVAELLGAPEPPEATPGCWCCEMREARAPARASRMRSLGDLSAAFITAHTELWASMDHAEFEEWFGEMASLLGEIRDDHG